MKMIRAYSIFDIKNFDDAARTFEGVATSPTPDRLGDIVEPLGAVWKLPIPMKWQHGKDPRIGDDQIGEITSAVKSPDGIRVKGTFWKFQTPPSLKDDYDRIWALVKAGMRGLSIGFNPLEYEPIKGTGGMRFLKWEFLELSPVTIPANASATILTVKEFDARTRAALGQQARSGVRLLTSFPGASGTIAAHQGAVLLNRRS